MNDRIVFVLEMVTTLIEKGADGFTEEEKKKFVDKVADRIKTLLT